MVSTGDYDRYLANKAASLVRENFSERGITNFCVVRWGRRWRSTLGQITPLKNEKFGSVIEINSLMKATEVPEYVLDSVLMHELVHYFQGFCSNHKRKTRYPHKGGAVDKELERLGWKEISKMADEWVKKNWDSFVANELGQKK